MKNSTVNISFKRDLLTKIDRVAKEESRSRSELIREAARLYIERKNRWNSLFALGDYISSKNDLDESDVVEEIESYRKSK